MNPQNLFLSMSSISYIFFYSFQTPPLQTRKQSLKGASWEEQNASHCVWCWNVIECTDHSFCSASLLPSFGIFKWVSTNVMLSTNIISLVDYFSSSFWSKKHQKGLTLIWHTTGWKIWDAKNDIIFSYYKSY